MKRLLLAITALFSLTTSAFANAHFVIQNTNAAGVGFNDTTPVAPVGGNTGTTIGQQRLNVFQKAVDIWGALIDSKVDIIIDASFASLTCTSNSGTLGQAGATKIFRNFDNAPQQNVWYVVALANALAGRDLNGGGPSIHAQFNSDLDTPNCLGGRGWYYGFDTNHGTQEDLLVVLLHELGHGLGFASVTNGTTGAMNSDFPSTFEQHMLDTTSGIHWSQMTNDQRLTSSINDQKVVWDGASTTAAALKFLDPKPSLSILSPASLSKSYQISAANFGQHLTVGGLNGTVAAATPSNGCTAITNGSAIAGRIALIDFGACPTITKVKNAQLAGATAVIIASNTLGGAPPLDGIDPTITIPSIGITQSDGAAIRAALPSTVNALLFLDATIVAGADLSGHPKLYVPAVFQGGSSISHFDTSATPNLLMEPNISSDLPSDKVDLTLNELLDIGWKLATTPQQGQTGRFAGRRGH
jgi:PA domain.